MSLFRDIDIRSPRAAASLLRSMTVFSALPRPVEKPTHGIVHRKNVDRRCQLVDLTS